MADYVDATTYDDFREAEKLETALNLAFTEAEKPYRAFLLEKS